MTHNYGLSWIDNETLFQVSKEKLAVPLGLTSKSKPKLPPDPFTMIAQSKAARSPLDEIFRAESTRSLNKTISDGIGTWHQAVLGAAPHWEDLGINGGVLDIRTAQGYLHPKWGKPIVAEVKNRFNTIKGVDEKNIWDQIRNAAKLSQAVGYLIQIVPKNHRRYDEPWNPSGRQPIDIVRHCDGATGYALVFEYEDALSELLEAFPLIIDDIFADFDVTPESLGEYAADKIRDLNSEVFGV